MKQFLKQTIASTLGTFLGLSIFLTVGVGSILLLAIALTSQQEPSVKEKSILVFNLSTLVKDGYSNKSLTRLLSSEDDKQTLMLKQIIEGIKKASKDPNIKAIFLDGRSNSNNNGYANLAEIRAALVQFKSNGKKIIAYANDWTEKNYYLASIADQIIINPMGSMEIKGLVSEPLFFAGALQKYGIGVQVVRVGSYKSAVEPYIRSNLSPENRQQLEKLLGDIWQNFLKTVGTSRQIEVNHLQEITDNIGFLGADKAKGEKLVDEVGYYDQAIAELKKISGTNEDTFSPISLDSYLEITENSNKKDKSNKIAILYAEGTITDGQGNLDEIGGDKFAKEIRNIRENDEIKAVVLRINSPGGSANASDVILREVKRLQEKKPVIISMGNVAASGGYWMATGGQYIFAEDNTITGSIGVFGMLLNLQKLANNNGITWDTVKTGKLADLNTSSRPKTQQEIDIYQKEVNRIYDLFLDKVSTSRHLTKEKVNEIAQGRVWSGYEAQKIGLVDQIGGLESAIKYTAQVAKLGDNWQVEEYPESRSWKNIFLDKISKTEIQNTSIDPVTQEWENLKEDWHFVKQLNDPQGLYLMFPYNLNIK